MNRYSRVDSPQRTEGKHGSEKDIDKIIQSSNSAGVLDCSSKFRDVESWQYFVETLSYYDSHAHWTSLRANNNRITAKGLSPLLYLLIETNSKTLKHLHIVNCDLLSDSGELLAAYLTQSEALEELNVSQNPLGDAGVGSLASCWLHCQPHDFQVNHISSFRVLQTLDLSDTGCGDTAVLMLCRGLTQCIRSATALVSEDAATPLIALSTLRLSGNRIGDSGAQCIADMLRNQRAHWHLTELSLDDNAAIGPVGMLALLHRFPESIRMLSMARCRPSIEVLRTVRDRLKDECQRIMTLVSHVLMGEEPSDVERAIEWQLLHEIHCIDISFTERFARECLHDDHDHDVDVNDDDHRHHHQHHHELCLDILSDICKVFEDMRRTLTSVLSPQYLRRQHAEPCLVSINLSELIFVLFDMSLHSAHDDDGDADADEAVDIIKRVMAMPNEFSLPKSFITYATQLQSSIPVNRPP